MLYLITIGFYQVIHNVLFNSHCTFTFNFLGEVQKSILVSQTDSDVLKINHKGFTLLKLLVYGLTRLLCLSD